MASFPSVTAQNTGSRFLNIVILGWYLASVVGSQFDRELRAGSQYSRNIAYDSWMEEEASQSAYASSADDEERIISALAQVEEVVDHDIPRSHYRPRARELASLKHPVDRDSAERDNGESRRRRRNRKNLQPKKKREHTNSIGSKSKDNHVAYRLLQQQNGLESPVATTLQTKVPIVSEAFSENTLASISTKRSSVSGKVNKVQEENKLDEVILPQKSPSLSIPTKQQFDPRHNDGSHLPNRATGSSPTTPWVRRYLNARPKDVLLPVPKEYIGDSFNLAQLAPIVERIGFQVMGAQAVEVAKQLVDLPAPQPSYPIYRLALQLLLNENEEDENIILAHPLIPPKVIQHAAEALYLMIHARFVTSPRGLDALRRILLNSPVFGKCPRPQCDGSVLLPYGVSNDFTCNTSTCQRYCACCGNLWNCWESKTDACAWGPSLCYLLLMAHGNELFPGASSRPTSAEMLRHPNDPRVFGFRIHPAAPWGHPISTHSR